MCSGNMLKDYNLTKCYARSCNYSVFLRNVIANGTKPFERPNHCQLSKFDWASPLVTTQSFRRFPPREWVTCTQSATGAMSPNMDVLTCLDIDCIWLYIHWPARCFFSDKLYQIRKLIDKSVVKQMNSILCDSYLQTWSTCIIWNSGGTVKHQIHTFYSSQWGWVQNMPCTVAGVMTLLHSQHQFYVVTSCFILSN